MKLRQNIPWFNPREMNDETILALSTGQDELLQQFFESAHQRQISKTIAKHWLVTGPRGGGKSFFLRTVQAQFNQMANKNIQLVLLPEEQKNIFSPHEWLNAVSQALDKNHLKINKSSSWNSQTTDQEWDMALGTLLDACKAELTIIAVENFDMLIKQAFNSDVDSSRLRNLLENQPGIMLLATAVDSSFDENYKKRLFSQFEHHYIQPWKPYTHVEYLHKRAKLEGQEPDTSQLARIDAYSHYTGGNARVASVLASLILEKQDPLLASADLAAILDKMTDYYRAQIERIPDKSFKLFDALLQEGEPCSQTELAARVGARQSDISRAFMWLLDFGYIIGIREKGQKATRYHVADRLFSQFYRMRYLQPGESTQLTLLADLLADTIEFADKWRFAERYFGDGHKQEARVMAELGLKQRNVNLEAISEKFQSTQNLIKLGVDWESRDNLPNILGLLKHFSTDADLVEAIDVAMTLAAACNRFGADLSGAELVDLTSASLSLSPIEKYKVYCAMTNKSFSQFQWTGLIQVFKDELKKFEGLAKNETNQNSIDNLKTISLLEKMYPLAVSLDDASTCSNFFKKATLPDKLSLQMMFAARATVLWCSNQRMAEAKKSLNRCFKVANELYEKFYSINEILKAFSLMEKYSGSKIDSSVRIDFVIAQCHSKLNHTEKALKHYHRARKLALQNIHIEQAINSLDQIAWCEALIGKYSQSIKTHKQALKEKKTQGNKSNLEWHFGQIARLKGTLKGIKEAWLYIDKQVLPNEKAKILCIQQLGDAIYDCVQQKGETQAFALASQLFLGLKKRPDYPVEACLRALWIDMIDIGVPFKLLHELAVEAEAIFTTNISPLVRVLVTWLDDLQQDPKQRIEHRKTLNPDLATTLEALGNSLSAKARARLNLLNQDEM